MSPPTPFAISGIVYDLDGTTAYSSGGTIQARNHTKDEETNGTIQANGEYTLDLANNDTQWENDDVIYLWTNPTRGKRATVRAQIKTGDETWEQDVYLQAGNQMVKTELAKFTSFFLYNATGTTLTVNFVSYEDDIQFCAAEVADNTNVSGHLDSFGYKIPGGVWVLKSATNITRNNQSAGVTNAIGDTTSNALFVATIKVV